MGTPSGHTPSPTPLLSRLLDGLPLSDGWRNALLGGAGVLEMEELREVLVSLGIEEDRISRVVDQVRETIVHLTTPSSPGLILVLPLTLA